MCAPSTVSLRGRTGAIDAGKYDLPGWLTRLPTKPLPDPRMLCGRRSSAAGCNPTSAIVDAVAAGDAERAEQARHTHLAHVAEALSDREGA